MLKGIQYIVGIDEVGRGPLAGPVVLGFVKISRVKHDDFFSRLKHLNITDSKKLSEHKREEIVRFVKKNSYKGFECCTIRSYQNTIDTKGISYAIKDCIDRGLKQMKCDPNKTMIHLDGALRAPSQFTHQKTTIKGDLTIPAISLASIIAKVTRDEYMEKISKKYPEYNFKQHKGYGTLEHRNALKKHGTCALHRKTYCKNFL